MIESLGFMWRQVPESTKNNSINFEQKWNRRKGVNSTKRMKMATYGKTMAQWNNEHEKQGEERPDFD